MEIGRFLGDVLTGGSTYFKRQKKAKKQEREAREQIAANTAMAEELYNRDYGTSQWENVQSDPALRAQQDRALSRLEGLSRTGFDSTDRQALDSAFMQSRREAQGNRDAALAAAARRGDASGGNALMGALSAEQGGANRAAQFATDVGLAGRDRALQALESGAALAGQVRGQDFGEQSQRAGGLDAFNQWATGQRTTDAQFLANARMGQASSLQQQAAQNRATPVLDAGVNFGANYLSMGQAGNVTGGGAPTNGVGQIAGTNGVAAPNANSSQGTFFGGTGGGAKSLTGGAAPADTTGGGMQKSMGAAPNPAQSYAARRRRPQQRSVGDYFRAGGAG